MTKDKTSDARLGEALSAFVEKSGVIDEHAAQSVDRELRSTIASITKGMSPMAILSAYVDWLGHLAISPGKLLLLQQSLVKKTIALGLFNVGSFLGSEVQAPVAVLERRMQSDAWQKWPFNVFAQGYELSKQWLEECTTDLPGVSEQSLGIVALMSQQIVQLLSPANFPFLNPDVIKATLDERGANLGRGMQNLLEDRRRRDNNELPVGTDDYRVGEEIAVTPGKVVYQNELIELIQYEPTTKEVAAEPVLIIPAWIMKYYILDLLPKKSMVKYLVENGKTVFLISWKNPLDEDHNLAMDDYVYRGVLASLDAISAITHSNKVHAVGYCLGGTLLGIVAALMAREGDDRLKSMTTFASQFDFTEPGEIQSFLGESAFAFLEAMMEAQGYLGIESMVGAFTSLRVTDLTYAPAVDRYLLGKEPSMNDLMAWNADGTRLPHRMHSEYLRNCYLDNNLAEARYVIDGRPICLGDITVPAFVLGTATDHVAPWKSVYKAVRLTNTETTFALTNGGHNAGIACGPDHPRRCYQIAVHRPGDNYIDPDTWFADTESNEGSWWPAWNRWLDSQTSGLVEPPPTGAPESGYEVLRSAPGEYVFG
ncbi:MAG: alpha/beta fold hydrolase [Gammaproteobacteria bacterium]|nr:alpha/beta fold hydrolase [Gammaproteobacteria bacterium]